MRPSPVARIGAIALLVGMAAVNIAPLWYMVVSALQEGGGVFVADRFWPPADPHWGNFAELFSERGFGRLILNSVLVTSLATLASLLVAAPAAFAFTRLRSGAAEAVFVGTVALIAIPPIVVLVPLFLAAARVGLVNSFAAPILIYTGFLTPFSVLVLRTFFAAVPRDLLEAARVDGAGSLRILLHVMLPLARAPLVALAVINGVWVWNELLIAIVFLQSESSRTLQAGIAFFSGRNVQDVPLIMAGSLVATIPILVLFALGQRAFVRGLTAGATKE